MSPSAAACVEWRAERSPMVDSSAAYCALALQYSLVCKQPKELAITAGCVADAASSVL